MQDDFLTEAMPVEQKHAPRPHKGRGAVSNPASRFETLSIDRDDDARQEWDENGVLLPPNPLQTHVYQDTSRSILSTNDSPDIGMEATLNPYRGCEHGCIYCFARPTHEYLGLSAGLDFETKIFAKTNAAELLAHTLGSRGWTPKIIFMSGVTDPYQPIEQKLRITRRCLQVLADFRNPVSFITKNHLITRDLDVLRELARHTCVSVNMSVTTLDRHLARIMEPRASTPGLRLKAIETLSRAGIPVTVLMGPVVPGLTEHEIPAILKAAADAGACAAGYTMLRLPHGVKDLFAEWVREHFPDRADKVLNRVRAIRDGKLNSAEFGARMVGEGFYAEQIAQIFKLAKIKNNLTRRVVLSTAAFKRDARNPQLSLF